ncbi:MAG: hypothetical protein BMS9Abin13_039 [Patescibacteria group bacterium]|nr:MAG: hypothetical protein BMS9Abin13_039 [Patescibacteria group bacterium]
MSIKVLHLNIEKQKHLKAVRNLMKTQKPDVACFVEINESDAKNLADDLRYEFVYSPLVSTEDGDTEGTAILSKIPILDSSDLRYDDDPSDDMPAPEEKTADGNRPKERFLSHSSVLTATIEVNKEKLTIATTHFPVTDHSTPGYKDHSFDETSDVREINHTRILFDRFISIIRKLPYPLIFTADLNNPRGEYMYDALAHELVDVIPKNIDSTIDPNLHRHKGLRLVVDTIMTSPDVRVDTVETIEGVSDHKAIVAVFDV